MPRSRLARQTAPEPHRLRRLSLEHLEDRSVPSTFTVNTTLDDVTPANGKFSLREAITKANTNPGADVIVLPAGVFKITLAGAGEDANLTGDFDITDAVTIQGAGAGISIVDGQQLDRVFDVLGTRPESIKAVFAGADRPQRQRDRSTAAASRSAMPTWSSATGPSAANRASATGGGIADAAFPGRGTSRSSAPPWPATRGRGGGGLSVTGSSVLTVKDSTIRRNIAGTTWRRHRCHHRDADQQHHQRQPRQCEPAAASSPATTATLTNCTVNGNSAVLFGGGIEAGTATLTNSTVSGNSSGSDGGGISAFVRRR